MILNAIEMGQGRPVVLMHGLFGAARNFRGIQRSLAPWFRVIALDMRNHGESPHAVDMRYTTQAEDVRETLLSLGIAEAVIVGHSMGGKAAMALALRWPEMASRLLVSDIAPVIYQHSNALTASAMQAVPLTASLTRRNADAFLSEAVSDAQLRQFLLQNLIFGPEPRWRIGLSEITSAISELEGWPQLSAIYQKPSLFVVGARSNYVLPQHRQTIKILFPSARFIIVKKAGHWVHVDDPQTFLSVLHAFIQGLT